MAHPWFRLWVDMPNDPKWRTISRKSGQKIGDVIAVAIHMMTCASNAAERGRLEGWNDEDAATALDIDKEQVEIIRETMQGRVLDSDLMTGWEKRQPKREREQNVPSTLRVQEFRERKRHETPCNANEDQETSRLEKIRKENIKPLSPNSDDLPGFAQFWKTWPATDRKVARAECAKRWKARGLEAESTAIVAHVAHQKNSKKWRDGYEPAPLTYINQQHWKDAEIHQGNAVPDSRFAGAK